MYEFTNDEDIIINTETGTFIPRGHRLWDEYEKWLAEGNTSDPVAPVLSLEEAKRALADAATAQRWEHETGGIAVGNARIGTTLDDQNRISGVLAAIGLGSLTAVDFKAESGWVRLTVQELQGIAQTISEHVQACFSAERAHHEAIADLEDMAQVEAYDVMAGWPSHGGEP